MGGEGPRLRRKAGPWFLRGLGWMHMSGGQRLEKTAALVCQVNHQEVRGLRTWPLSSAGEPSGGQRFEKVAALICR